MSRTDKWVIVFTLAVLLISLGTVVYVRQGRIVQELDLARTETAQAQEALEVSRTYTNTVKKELAGVLLASTARIQKADATIAGLEDSVAQSREDLDKLLGEKRELLDLINTINVEDIPDAPIADILVAGADLYPNQDLSGMQATANQPARGLFQLMILEVGERRELALKNDRIQEDYQNQIYRLEMIIENQEEKFLALNRYNGALLGTGEALQIELEASQQVIQTLQKQVGLWEAQNRFAWMQKPAIVGGLVLSYFIVKEVIDGD